MNPPTSPYPPPPCLAPRTPGWGQRIYRWEGDLHGIFLPGALAIGAFGYFFGRLLGWETARWLALWIAAGLLAYNLDRLRADPADAQNVPERWEAMQRLRPQATWLVRLAAGLLVVIPLATADWLTLAAVLAGSAVCLAYSLPRPGQRAKDWPLLKTFFPAAAVVAAVMGLPLLHRWELWHTPGLLLAALWATLLLTVNTALFDLRDLAGDTQHGTRTLPVVLGPQRTRALLWGAVPLLGAGAASLGLQASAATRAAWLVLALLAPVYSGLLLWATRRPCSERFYERWVDGILWLPALACLLAEAR